MSRTANFDGGYTDRPCPTPPFPEEVLTEIGRVAVAAAKLEFILAEFSSEIHSGMTAADLLSRAGKVLPAARQAVDALEPSTAQLFKDWGGHAEQLLSERHHAIHTMWMLRAAAPGVAEYFGMHPRTKQEMDIDLDALRNIAIRLDKCFSDGFELIFTNFTKT